MGSLASRPKAPKVSTAPVIYYAPSAPANLVTPPPVTQTPAPSSDDIAAQARGLGLLGRSRGRLSTVLTGFRGILGRNETAPQRKTLLGE
jgi:hypothetical protein